MYMYKKLNKIYVHAHTKAIKELSLSVFIKTED